MQMAIINRKYEIAEELVKAGADTSVRSHNGVTARKLAMNCKDDRFAELLTRAEAH